MTATQRPLRAASSSASPSTGPWEARAFPAAEMAPVLSEILERARLLAESGVRAQRSLGAYLKALGPVLSFIHAHAELRDEPSLCPEVRKAMLRVAQELEPGADAELAQPPLCIPPPLSIAHEEASRTGALLLAAFRAAIEHIAETNKPLLHEFGVGDRPEVRNGLAVANGIARFLAAAQRYPEVLGYAGLSASQLVGLAAQERVLRAHAAQRQKLAVTPGLEHRAPVLTLALEHFFERFAAALEARCAQDRATLVLGRRLMPGLGGSPGVRTGSAWTGPPRYASCQLTDSGRLIFS